MSRPFVRIVLAPICLIGLAPTGASAEGDPAAEAPPAVEAPAAPEAGVRYAPVTRHDFETEEVGGRIRNPDGDWVEGRAGQPGASLVRIRTSFRAELLQSAQDL